MRKRGKKKEKNTFHDCEMVHDNSDLYNNTQSTHSHLVCEVKVRVSLAKSSLFSNSSSLALTQKLLSHRSSGPI